MWLDGQVTYYTSEGDLTYSSVAADRDVTGWSTEETRTLLGFWGAADVQAQLDGLVRN